MKTIPGQTDIFGGVAEDIGPAPIRSAGGRSNVAEYFQIAAGQWVLVVYQLIPKNYCGHLLFPHYFGAPAEHPRWRVDRHGRETPGDTFLFESLEQAREVVAEAFPDPTSMYQYMDWISIPTTDYRMNGKRAGRKGDGDADPGR